MTKVIYFCGRLCFRVLLVIKIVTIFESLLEMRHPPPATCGLDGNMWQVTIKGRSTLCGKCFKAYSLSIKVLQLNLLMEDHRCEIPMIRLNIVQDLRIYRKLQRSQLHSSCGNKFKEIIIVSIASNSRMWNTCNIFDTPRDEVKCFRSAWDDKLIQLMDLIGSDV